MNSFNWEEAVDSATADVKKNGGEFIVAADVMENEGEFVATVGFWKRLVFLVLCELMSPVEDILDAELGRAFAAG